MSSDYKSEILRFLESCCDYLEAGGRLKKGDIPAFDKSALSRVSREGSVIILKLRDLTNALNKSSGYIPPKSQWTKSGDDFVFSKEVQDRSKIKVKPPKPPKPAPAKPTKAPKSPVGPQQGTGLTAGDIETIKATAAKLKSWDANKNNEEIAKYINQNKKKETGDSFNITADDVAKAVEGTLRPTSSLLLKKADDDEKYGLLGTATSQILYESGKTYTDFLNNQVDADFTDKVATRFKELLRKYRLDVPDNTNITADEIEYAHVYGMKDKIRAKAKEYRDKYPSTSSNELFRMVRYNIGIELDSINNEKLRAFIGDDIAEPKQRRTPVTETRENEGPKFSKANALRIKAAAQHYKKDHKFANNHEVTDYVYLHVKDLKGRDLDVTEDDISKAFSGQLEKGFRRASKKKKEEFMRKAVQTVLTSMQLLDFASYKKRVPQTEENQTRFAKKVYAEMDDLAFKERLYVPDDITFQEISKFIENDPLNRTQRVSTTKAPATTTPAATPAEKPATPARDPYPEGRIRLNIAPQALQQLPKKRSKQPEQAPAAASTPETTPEKPAETTSAEKPPEKPTETTPTEKPAEKPAETTTPEKPAEAPAEKPAEEAATQETTPEKPKRKRPKQEDKYTDEMKANIKKYAEEFRKENPKEGPKAMAKYINEKIEGLDMNFNTLKRIVGDDIALPKKAAKPAEKGETPAETAPKEGETAKEGEATAEKTKKHRRVSAKPADADEEPADKEYARPQRKGDKKYPEDEWDDSLYFTVRDAIRTYRSHNPRHSIGTLVKKVTDIINSRRKDGEKIQLDAHMAKRIAPDAARPMELVDGQAPKRVAKHDEDKWDPFLLSEFRRQAVDYRNTYPTHSMKLLIQNVKERLKADKTTKEEKAAIDNLKITANMLKRVAPDYAAPRPDPNKQAKKAATPKGGAKLIAALTDTVKESIQDAVTDFRKKNPYAPIKALVEHVNKTVRKDNGESYVFKSPTLRKLINNEAVYQPKKKVGIDVLDDAVKQKIREKAKEFRDQNPYSPIREMAEYVNNHVTDTDGKHYGMNAQRLKEILGDEGLSIYRPQPKPRRERKRSRSGPSRPVDLPEDVQNKVRDLAKSYRESNPYASPEDLRKYVNENLHMNKEDGTPYDIGFVTLENIVDDDNVFYARRKPREGSTPTSSRKKNTTSNVNVYSDETYEKIINATEQALKDIGQDPSSQGLARYIRKEGDKAKRYITTYVNKKLGTTNIPLPQIIYANIQFNMTTDSRAVEVSNFMREWQREEEKNMKSKHSVSPEERRRRRLLNLYKYAWKYAYEKAPQTSFVDAIPALDYILTQNPPELHGKPVMVDELNEALRTDWTRKEKSEINAFLAPSKEARKQRDKVERERKKEENAKKKEAEKERKRLEKENQKRAAERAEAAEKLKQAQEKIRELESRKMTFTPMTEAQIANAAQAGQSIDAVKGMDWLGERIATNSNNRINEKIAEQQKIIEDIYKRFSELKPPRTGGYTQQTPRKFAPLFTLPIPEKPRRFVKVYKK